MHELLPRDGLGTLLTMEELRCRLEHISVGPYQWTAKLENEGLVHEPHRYVDIYYSNPDPPDMPNELCFRFPVLDHMPWMLDEPLLCLHPSLADLRQHGLYFEGDRLLRDELEDFGRFWTPLVLLL